MQGNNTRRRSITRNGVVVSAGSVWETRMKMDQVKGGIKVFNGDTSNTDNNRDEEGMRVYRRLVRNQSDPSSMEKRKRRSWRQPEIHDDDDDDESTGNGIQLKRSVSEPSKEDNVSVEDEVEVDKEMDLVVVVDEAKSEVKEKVDDEIFETPAPSPEKIDIDIDLRGMHPDPVKPPSPVSNAKIEEEEMAYQCETKFGDHNKMQSIVDLVMWREISKSAFVFGFGSFFLLSSSYAKDLEFSLISAISYLGLVYLALIFVYKSILQRGAGMEYYDEMDERNRMVVIGEEEAVWIVRFLLPYINEILLKIKALFSGDPATTMKLAVLLFVMARCGSSITIWTLSKLLFFGVFTVPKLCCSSSFQLARYGNFWLERVKDGWESCTHKKAVAAAIFTVLWNLSSIVARIWGVFMILVAMKLYQQQCMVAQEWNVEEVEEEVGGDARGVQVEDSKAVDGPLMGPSLGLGPRSHRQKSGPVMDRKLKKWH